jgi:hypothetical protein
MTWHPCTYAQYHAFTASEANPRRPSKVVAGAVSMQVLYNAGQLSGSDQPDVIPTLPYGRPSTSITSRKVLSLGVVVQIGSPSNAPISHGFASLCTFPD